MKKSTVLLSVLLLVAVAFAAWKIGGLTGAASAAVGEYDDFAKCITEKGAVFYGAYWCPHCQNQKEMFGSSVQYVNYVECSLPNKSGQTEICNQKGITGYPTWDINGEFVSGTQSLEALSLKTGCPLE